MSQSKPSRRSYKKFSLQDYQDNPEAVKKANDALMDYVETELGNANRLRKENLRLKRENILLKERTRPSRGKPIFQSYLAFLGGVLITIGAGSFLSSHDLSIFSPSGLLLGFGIVVSLFAIFSIFNVGSRGGKL